MEYGTGQVARLMGVRPNAVRLYEKAGPYRADVRGLLDGREHPDDVVRACDHLRDALVSAKYDAEEILVLIDKVHALAAGKCVRKPSANTPGFSKRV